MARKLSNLLLSAALFITPFAPLMAGAQQPASHEAAGLKGEIPEAALIQPADLVTALQKSATPLILQVGSRSFYDQAHIVGAEYVGATGTEAGLKALHDRVAEVGKDRWIVVYCGCCPWDRCPNIRPAFHQLQAMGFTHVQALYLPTNFGEDWVGKNYPTEK